MKILELILWVTQFGLSVMLPPCFFLFLAHWLQTAHGWGMWTSWAGGVLGLLISVSTARANWKSMKKAAGLDSGKEPPVSFNGHD